jgi:hypothetical protein
MTIPIRMMAKAITIQFWAGTPKSVKFPQATRPFKLPYNVGLTQGSRGQKNRTVPGKLAAWLAHGDCEKSQKTGLGDGVPEVITRRVELDRSVRNR